MSGNWRQILMSLRRHNPLVSSVGMLTPDALKGLEAALLEGRCLLVDVREKHEHEAGHIPLSVNLPLSQAGKWSKELDRDRPLILYCRTTNRSKRCAEGLIGMGFRDVRVLNGGYLAWSASGLSGRF